MGPQEIVLGNDGKPLPPVVQVAAKAPAATFSTASVSSTPVKLAPAPDGAAAAAPAASGSAFGVVNGLSEGSKSLMSGLIARVSGEPQLRVYEPAEPIPSDVPLPPKRSAALDNPMRMATAKVDDAAQ
jgi:hypothetical protein